MTHCSIGTGVSLSVTMVTRTRTQAQARRVKMLREQFSLTQQAFASRARIARSTITMVESEQRGIGVDTAEKIASAFSVSPLWLLWGEGEENQ
jgi:transcriptional regulator with XRE-family HTH domain